MSQKNYPKKTGGNNPPMANKNACRHADRLVTLESSQYVNEDRMNGEKKLTWDDGYILLEMWLKCPAVEPLLVKGESNPGELGHIATLLVVQTESFITEKMGKESIFSWDLKTGKITMLRWHKDLLSALKIMAEQEKKLPDTNSVTVKTHPTTASNEKKGKIYSQIHRMYNLGLLSKESAIEELQKGGFSWDEAGIVLLWEGE